MKSEKEANQRQLQNIRTRNFLSASLALPNESQSSVTANQLMRTQSQKKNTNIRLCKITEFKLCRKCNILLSILFIEL